MVFQSGKTKLVFFKFFVNKNGKVLDLVDYKSVVPKGQVLKNEGREVYSGTSLQRPCLGSSLLTLVESLAAFRVYFLL